MIRKIDHIGVAVKDLERAVATFVDALGLGADGREYLADRQLETFFCRAGEVHVELLKSLSPDTPIGKYIERRGEGLHHICFEVEDLDEALARCRQKGIEVIGEPETGAQGKRIAFLHPRSTHGVLIELSQDAPPA